MKLVHVLLVEDNDGDILLIKEAFEDAKIHINISVVKDGKEAMDFLNKENKYTTVETPDLLLLDINLPKKNGHEVLQYIKGNENLRQIPVVILTTSSADKDINKSYSNYVNCYITKPVDVNDFLSIVSTIENFWISVVKLPTKRN